MDWGTWIQDVVSVVLAHLDRIADAAERLADAADKEAERDG